MTDRPLRVWLYRGWCWVCRECRAADWGHPSWQSAMLAALHHCDMAQRQATPKDAIPDGRERWLTGPWPSVVGEP